MTISAKVVCDSIANDVRLTTLELYYPRFVHSEFMTHRMFSRNASSSRAIPIEKVRNQVIKNPAMPIHWGKNQPGMQANDEVINVSECIEGWKLLAEFNAEASREFEDTGLHKQVVNRLLEPYLWIKVIVTATEWKNFFDLRLHPDAQPEIMELAKCMKEAMDNSTPNELEVGEWHLPYVDSFPEYVSPKLKDAMIGTNIKCSVARCARVSYLNHDKTSPDIEKDIELHDRLLESGHFSPFEHVATPMDFIGAYTWEDLEDGETHVDNNGDKWSGNLRGWVQYRQLVAGE